MLLTFDSTRARWEALATPAQAEPLRRAGLQFDTTVRTWFTTDDATARRLVSFADASARAALDDAAAQRLNRVRASCAVDAPNGFAVPVPSGLSLFPYQLAGVAYLWQRDAALLGDDMGLGKTAQALSVLLLMRQASSSPDTVRALIVCPKIACENWRREVHLWAPSVPVDVGTVKKFPGCAVVVISYDTLIRMKNTVDAVHWDIVIYDEAHVLANPDTKRTRAALGGGRGKTRMNPVPARRRLFLTGTPLVNGRPLELHPILEACALEFARDYSAYVDRYCGGSDRAGGGSSNLTELQERLRGSGVFVRRLKSDVLHDLPAIRHQLITIPVDRPEHVAALHDQNSTEQRLRDDTQRLQADVESTRGTDAYAGAVRRLSTGRAVGFAEMSRIRHAVGMAKIPDCLEHIIDVLNGSTESALIFAHHGDVIAALQDGLEAAGFPCSVITGQTSERDRQHAESDLQNGVKRVFIGSISACGVAINLTRASLVFMVEQDWTPGKMDQAAARAHRNGQKFSVLVQTIVLDGSVDARIAHVLADKNEYIREAIDVFSE